MRIHSPPPHFRRYRAWWGTEAGHVGAEARLAGYPAWSLAAAQSDVSATGVTIVALSAASAVQLAVNGVPFGAPQSVPALGYVQWSAVPYAPGNYTLTSLDAHGAVLGTFVSATAGAASALAAEVEWPGSGPAGAEGGRGSCLHTAAPPRCTPATGALRAGGVDVALIRISVLDAAGVLVPSGSINVTFAVVSGPGEVVGLCSGDETDHLPRLGPSSRPTFRGLLMATVRAGTAATGQPLVLQASAPGLSAADISIQVV